MEQEEKYVSNMTNLEEQILTTFVREKVLFNKASGRHEIALGEIMASDYSEQNKAVMIKILKDYGISIVNDVDSKMAFSPVTGEEHIVPHVEQENVVIGDEEWMETSVRDTMVNAPDVVDEEVEELIPILEFEEDANKYIASPDRDFSNIELGVHSNADDHLANAGYLSDIEKYLIFEDYKASQFDLLADMEQLNSDDREHFRR
jgi:hypothetical protein